MCSSDLSRGFLSEGIGSNIFLVKDGVLLTPRTEFVLPGVSRAVVFELAQSAGLRVEETDLTPQQARDADEAFVTSTSFCICPVRSYDHILLNRTSVPGPVTTELSAAFSREVGLDFRRQYLDCLE